MRAWDTATWTELFEMHGFLDEWVQLSGRDPTAAHVFAHTQESYYRIWNMSAVDALMSADPSVVWEQSKSRFALVERIQDQETTTPIRDWFATRFGVTF